MYLSVIILQCVVFCIVAFKIYNIYYKNSAFIIKEPTHDTGASKDGSVHSFVYVHPQKVPYDLPITKKWIVEPVFMPSAYSEMAQVIYDLDVRSDDIWVISFPKSGTTWTQEMVWLLANNLDLKKANEIIQDDRYQYMERVAINTYTNSTVARMIAAPSPRFIKSHLPPALLPKALWTVRPKIVYVARNPKDTAISRYHFYSKLKNWRGSFNDFMELFVNDQFIYAPYHSHVQSFWNMRDEDNVLFLTFEEMKSNFMDILRRTAAFLDKSYDDNDLQNVKNYLSFEQMKSNRAVNKDYIAKGLNSKQGYLYEIIFRFCFY